MSGQKADPPESKAAQNQAAESKTAEQKSTEQKAAEAKTARAVYYVCDHLADLRGQLERGDGTEPLDRLLAAIRAGGELTGLLDELHAAVQAGGDALGIYGQTRSVGPRPAGIGRSRAAQVVFLCPVDQCSRTWWPDDSATERPACQIHDQPLRWEFL
jgi:hypothetical protein